MFATRVLRTAERQPLIKFIGKRSTPQNIDHTPKVHPASGLKSLPESFSSTSSAPKSTSFSSYRQNSQNHGPLGRTKSAEGSIGAISGHSLGSVQPEKGMYFDRSELPARFRRAVISADEIDAIETGGATMVC